MVIRSFDLLVKYQTVKTLTFLMLLLSSADFFQNLLFHRILSGTTRVSDGLGPDQDRCSVGPDLGPNGLQRLSEDDRSHR